VGTCAPGDRTGSGFCLPRGTGRHGPLHRRAISDLGAAVPEGFGTEDCRSRLIACVLETFIDSRSGRRPQSLQALSPHGGALIDYHTAVRRGEIVLEGPRSLVRALPRYFMWSPLAHVARKCQERQRATA